MKDKGLILLIDMVADPNNINLPETSFMGRIEKKLIQKKYSTGYYTADKKEKFIKENYVAVLINIGAPFDRQMRKAKTLLEELKDKQDSIPHIVYTSSHHDLGDNLRVMQRYAEVVDPTKTSSQEFADLIDKKIRENQTK